MSSPAQRIGVFVCDCGLNIAGTVDTEDVARFAKTLPGVAAVVRNRYTCADPGQNEIKKAVVEHHLDRVVVASCTPKIHEPTFRRCVQDVGLNPYLMEMANIREQCSWVHMGDRVGATRKAKDLVRSAVERALLWYASPERLRDLVLERQGTGDAYPGLIVIANHPSLLDALMLVARLPRAACVMKASLMRNPLLAPGARLARYIRNDTPSGLVRLAVDDLRAGGQLVLFPEGTRTTRQPLNPFRPGFTLIAKMARAPIQTVFIDTDSPYLGKGWPIWRLPPLPIVFRARLGRRFEPRDDHHVLVAEVQAHFMQGLRAGPMAQGPRQQE